MKFHTNDAGVTSECGAKIKCPFGGDTGFENHYETAAEAREAYEKKMTAANFKPKAKPSLKSLDEAGLKRALINEAKEAGFSLVEIKKAIVLATELHQGQFRRAAPGEKRPPYITHPLRNALRVIRWGAKDENNVLAAMLHDVIEDGTKNFAKNRGLTPNDEHEARALVFSHIETVFNHEVAIRVEKMSNPIVDKEEFKTRTVEEKHASYREHVAEAIRGNKDVFLTKLSDLHDNGAGLFHTAFKNKREQTINQAHKYLGTLGVFRDELERLDFDNKDLHLALEASLGAIEARLRFMLADDFTWR